MQIPSSRFVRRAAAAAIALAAVTLAGALTPPPAHAQAYPTKAVRVIVPFPAGATDNVARVLSARFQASMGQPFVVENRPGAGGNIGADAVAKSAPDGYTLLVAAASLVTAPILSPNLPFSPTRDLAPIGMVASAPNVLVTAPTSPFKTFPEMIAYAKANPGKLSYASAGNTTLSHLLGAWLKSEGGIDIVHVPYKGGGPAAVDVLAGRVPLFFDVLATATPNIRAGKLVPLAITAGQRAAAAPEIPAIAESGYPNFVGQTWLALLAPARVPAPVLAQLSAELNKALQSAEMRRDLAGVGMNPDFSTPEQFAAFYRAESDKWAKIIAAAGIKADD